MKEGTQIALADLKLTFSSATEVISLEQVPDRSGAKTIRVMSTRQ